MNLTSIQSIVGDKFKVEWNEDKEESPIRLKLKTKNKHEIEQSIVAWTIVLEAVAGRKATREKDESIRIKIRSAENIIHASLYKTGTVMLQCKQKQPLSEWMESNWREIISKVNNASNNMDSTEVETEPNQKIPNHPKKKKIRKGSNTSAKTKKQIPPPGKEIKIKENKVQNTAPGTPADTIQTATPTSIISTISSYILQPFLPTRLFPPANETASAQLKTCPLTPLPLNSQNRNETASKSKEFIKKNIATEVIDVHNLEASKDHKQKREDEDKKDDDDRKREDRENEDHQRYHRKKIDEYQQRDYYSKLGSYSNISLQYNTQKAMIHNEGTKSDKAPTTPPKTRPLPLNSLSMLNQDESGEFLSCPIPEDKRLSTTTLPPTQFVFPNPLMHNQYTSETASMCTVEFSKEDAKFKEGYVPKADDNKVVKGDKEKDDYEIGDLDHENEKPQRIGKDDLKNQDSARKEEKNALTTKNDYMPEEDAYFEGEDYTQALLPNPVHKHNECMSETASTCTVKFIKEDAVAEEGDDVLERDDKEDEQKVAEDRKSKVNDKKEDDHEKRDKDHKNENCHKKDNDDSAIKGEKNAVATKANYIPNIHR